MTAYGCHNRDISTHGIIVQDGYRYTRMGDSIERVPVLEWHKTQWMPIACGYLESAADPWCAGCKNRSNSDAD